MIIDSNLSFVAAGTGQAVTATAASTNILDLLNGRDLGVGDNDLKVSVIADNTWASNTSAATLTVQFQGAPDNGSGSPGSYTTYAESEAYTVANLTNAADTVLLPIEVPARAFMGAEGQGVSLPRFYRLNFLVAGGENFTAGNILFAGIVLDAERPTLYPSGFTVNN